MTTAIVAASILCALGAVHLYWAAGGSAGKDGAIPSRAGKPLFVPGAFATAAVGAALFMMAEIVMATAMRAPADRIALPLRAVTGLIALVFVLRAIGDFRIVGFFKRVRDSRFARRDTFAYSPLCLLLAGLIGTVAAH